MSKVIIWVFFMILATLGGCATSTEVVSTKEIIKNDETSAFGLPIIETGSRPEWLSGSSTKYPKSTFILMHTEASTAKNAVTTAHRKMINLLRPLPEAADIEELEPEISIAGLWLHNDTYYALAVFPRELADQHLRGKLEMLDAMTETTVAKINSTNDMLTKIGLLYSAIERQKLRAAYQKSLKKVDLEGRGRESPWNTLKWSNEAAQLIAALNIKPIIDQKTTESESLLIMLENGLMKAGIESTDNSTNDQIEASLLITYEDTDSGWVQARGVLDVKLINGGETRQMGYKIWNLEAAALNAETAKNRILSKSKRILEPGLRDVIIGIAMDSETSLDQ